MTRFAVVASMSDRLSVAGSQDAIEGVLRVHAQSAILPGSWPPFLTGTSSRPFSPPMNDAGNAWRGLTHGARYGWADQLGYGFCHDCGPDDRKLDAYTAEDDEVCDRCGRLIVSVKHPHNTKSSERCS